MKKVISVLLCVVSLFGKSYEAVLEPIESITISSEVSGVIHGLDRNNELKSFNGVLCMIDSDIDKKQLTNYKEKLKILEKIAEIKKVNYEKISGLSGKNIKEIENYHVDYLNVLSSIQDLKNNIDQLQDRIAKKSFLIKNRYIKTLFVSNNEFVNTGTKLFEIEDHSFSKLVFFVNEEDLVKLRKGEFKLAGDFKVNKVSKSTDETFISFYRVELISSKMFDFGKKYRIEI